MDKKLIEDKIGNSIHICFLAYNSLVKRPYNDYIYLNILEEEAKKLLEKIEEIKSNIGE